MTSLFSTPKPPKPVAMPDPENAAVLDARKKELLAARQRSGRASTMLTGDDSYSGITTGAP